MTAVRKNCLADQIVLTPCPSPLHCPGLCLASESGSGFFRRIIAYEMKRSGTKLAFDEKCEHGRFPWPWSAPQEVVRIVRHPVERMLSAYLNHKHTKRAPGYAFSYAANFTKVVERITSLPDTHVHSSFRRQTAMCVVAPGVATTRVLRLEEYARWRSKLAREFHWPLLLNLAPKNDIGVDVMARFYTPDLLRRVETWAADEMQTFGYASMFHSFRAEWKRQQSWQATLVTRIEDLLS